MIAKAFSKGGIIVILVIACLLTRCGSFDSNLDGDEPNVYHEFKVAREKQVVILEEKLNSFSYIITDNYSLDKMEDLPKYIFDFKKMKIIKNFGEVEIDALIKVDSPILNGTMIESYLYGVNKIDGKHLVAFQDSILLFNINTTWQEGIILNKFYDNYVEELLAFDSLRVFMSNLPSPPPPRLPERIE